MLKTRIVSLSFVGEQAMNQAKRLDSALEGMLIPAVVKKDDDNNPIDFNGEFEVRFEEAHGLAVERCIEQHNFGVINVSADTETPVAA